MPFKMYGKAHPEWLTPHGLGGLIELLLEPVKVPTVSAMSFSPRLGISLISTEIEKLIYKIGVMFQSPFDADRPCDLVLRWGLVAPQLGGISLIFTNGYFARDKNGFNAFQSPFTYCPCGLVQRWGLNTPQLEGICLISTMRRRMI